MKNHRKQPHLDSRSFMLLAPEMVLGIVISHCHSEREMTGNGEQSPRESHVDPICSGTDHINNILERGEAKSDSRGVDNAVIALVKFRAVAEQ